jgi:hypothetical protein
MTNQIILKEQLKMSGPGVDFVIRGEKKIDL